MVATHDAPPSVPGAAPQFSYGERLKEYIFRKNIKGSRLAAQLVKPNGEVGYDRSWLNKVYTGQVTLSEDMKRQINQILETEI
jgi:hypothetical protein